RLHAARSRQWRHHACRTFRRPALRRPDHRPGWRRTGNEVRVLMSRKVLLVEPDIDVLGDLASRLRAVGLTVGLADQVQGALERARSLGPDAILLSAELVKTSD